MKKRFLGISFAIVSAVIFGVMPLMTKMLYKAGANSVSVPFFRAFIVAVVIASFMCVKKISFCIDIKSLLHLILASLLGMSLTSILLYQSYYTIPSGMATTVHFLYPVLVTLLTVLIFKQRAPKIKYLAVGLSFLGIVLLFDINTHAKITGVVYAFLSAVTYAIYILIVGSAAIKKCHAVTVAFYLNTFATILIGGFGVATKMIHFDYTVLHWIYIIIFSVVVGIGGSVFFQFAVKYIGGQSASILSTFEPITSIIIGVLLLDEVLNIKTGIGMFLILIAALIVIVLEAGQKGSVK